MMSTLLLRNRTWPECPISGSNICREYLIILLNYILYTMDFNSVSIEFCCACFIFIMRHLASGGVLPIKIEASNRGGGDSGGYRGSRRGGFISMSDSG